MCGSVLVSQNTKPCEGLTAEWARGDTVRPGSRGITAPPLRASKPERLTFLTYTISALVGPLLRAVLTRGPGCTFCDGPPHGSRGSENRRCLG